MKMKNLSECAPGSRASVVKIHAEGALKQRLISFGIMKGAMIDVLAFSATKSTVEIKIGKMRLALRKQEAKMIEVQTDE